MQKISALLIGVILLISCASEYQSREIESVEITTFTIDSTSIRAIHVVNDSTLYYAGSNGDIGFTNSGGSTWDIETFQFQDSIIPHFRSIASNRKKIFVLSVGSPALLYSYDFSEKSLVYIENHEKVFYDAMKFFDETHGIAMGDPTEDCLSILLTDDGGKSWSKVPCEKLPKADDGEAAFAASNTNIKVIGSTAWIVTGGKNARVFKSEDYGQSWKVFNTPIIHGDGPQGIYSVDFYDEKNGFIIGGDFSKPNANMANKAFTTDGGETWTLVSDGKEPNYKSCVQYVPDTNGKEVFAVGKTGVSFSNDGGLTWKQVSDDGFYTIQFANRNVAWLAGNQKVGKMILP